MTLEQDSYWPESGPDQDVFVDTLQKRVDKLRYAIKPVVVPKFTEPNQADWEGAWSKKTGLWPPIPPGTKLFWYDLSGGEVRQYTVVYNLGNGTDSDGTVFPVKLSTDNSSYFRFLGSLSRRGTMLSALAKPDNTVTTLMINPEIWMQRGLLRLIIEMSLDMTTASMRLFLNTPKVPAVGDYELFNYASARYDMTTMAATRGPGAALSVIIGGGGVSANGGELSETFTVSPSKYPFVGRIIIDFGRTKEDEKQYFGSLVSLLGGSFGAAASSSDISLHYGVLSMDIPVNPLRYQVYLRDTGAPNSPLNGTVNDRAWIYGVFGEVQESELGEF